MVSHLNFLLYRYLILIVLFFFLLTDYASRGTKKFGDKCDETRECGFPGSECEKKKKSCQCHEHLPVTNHIDKCGKGELTTFFFFLFSLISSKKSISKLVGVKNWKNTPNFHFFIGETNI